MSVGLQPTTKYDIVDDFQSTGNKTKTAEKFGVSPRTVGRVINEYDDRMNDPIYAAIYKEMDVLVMPDNYLSDIDRDQLNDTLIDYGFLEDSYTIDDFIKNEEEPIGVILQRIACTDSVGGEEEELDEMLIEVELEPEEKVDWQLVATAQSITVTKTDSTGSDSVEVSKGTDNFRKAWQTLREVDMSDEVQVDIAAEEIYTLGNPALAIEKFSQGALTVDVKAEKIYWGDIEVHNSLTSRIIKMIYQNGLKGVQSLVNFLEKLMENPSYRAVNSLYDFLQHNDIEINQDGNFYAWKKVRSDYTDVHTGTFDNSVGKEVSMPRNMVNEDPEQTCSAGLHVAALHYVSCFGGDKLLKCEVDPRDVVAIPIDYKNSKMRTCRYKVVEDVTGKVRY